jgi:hypothetical protein
MKRTPCRPLALLLFALVIVWPNRQLSSAVTSARVRLNQPQFQLKLAAPRQPISVKLPTEADAAQFADRINKLINDYLQPLQPSLLSINNERLSSTLTTKVGQRCATSLARRPLPQSGLSSSASNRVQFRQRVEIKLTPDGPRVVSSTRNKRTYRS